MVSIVIVNYNGRIWLKSFLGSIFSQTYDNFEVIFIDNASTDDSLTFIKKYYPIVRIIDNKTNVGFGEANNVGVKKAKGDIIFFLNNDTLLPKDVLEKLILYKKKHNLNILGPKILNYKGEDIYGGKRLSVDITGYLGYGQKSFYIDGCALIIDKKDFLKLGGFDEKYFMYSEEIDLCWRAHLLGMKVAICENTSIKHFAGGTGGSTLYNRNKTHLIPIFRRYEVEKNNLRNVLKNYELINLFWILLLFMIQSLSEFLLYLLTGRFSAGKAILNAYFWNLKNFPDTLKHRKTIQKERKITDREILSMVRIGSNKLSALMTIGIPRFKK